jgi:hypothetical protein
MFCKTDWRDIGWIDPSYSYVKSLYLNVILLTVPVVLNVVQCYIFLGIQLSEILLIISPARHAV